MPPDPTAAPRKFPCSLGPLAVAAGVTGMFGQPRERAFCTYNAGAMGRARQTLGRTSKQRIAAARRRKRRPPADLDLARLAAIVESSDDAIISKNLDGVITSWNGSAERLFGYRPAEIIGRPLSILIPPDRRDEEEGILARLRRGERIDHYETTRIARDGRLLEVSLTVSPLRDGAGRIIGASKIVRDIGERKRMEGEVWQGRVKLRAILDTAIDAIISIDGRGLIQAVNPATERMFGYTPAELIGQNVKVLMPAPYHEEHDGYLSRYKHTGEKRIIGIGREVQARRKDGTVFAIDLAVSEVEAGKLFTGIIRDISDRKASEAKLRETDRLASIGTLAAGLGHDMNNVLLPVRARLNALKAEGTRGQLSATAAGDVAEISKSVTYLQQLADGLHFLAMDPQKEDGSGSGIGLATWWDQAGVLISKAVPKHVRVTASFSSALPEVAVSAAGLTQAVLNLVVNAGDAIPADRKRRQGHVRLRAEANKAATHVRLAVNDNGRGMSDEVKRRAFDMFFTTKPRGLGTGLGLSLVRKVADQAGGSVEIESAVGQGTTVVMNLPVAVSPRRDQVARAVITMTDGRAAAMIRHVIEGTGAIVNADSDPAGASIWVTEPSAQALESAETWRKDRPNGLLVLFGSPDRQTVAGWDALRPVFVADRDDLGAIRAAIARDVSSSKGVS